VQLLHAFVAPNHLPPSTPTLRSCQLLLQCLADTGSWEDGLAVVEEAFQLVPATHVEPLWADRVLFMSKRGQVCCALALRHQRTCAARKQEACPSGVFHIAPTATVIFCPPLQLLLQ
jgi:hypothetical protein